MWRKKTATDTSRQVEWLGSAIEDRDAEVLDVGCGFGFFVDAAARAGYRVTGIDPNTVRHDLAKKHLDGDFILGVVDEEFVNKNRNRFKAVTLFQVLEHMRAPEDILRLCFGLLADGGKILVEVPNLGDEMLNENDGYTAFYWQMAHLNYFDAPRLGLVLRSAGIKDFTISGVQRYGLRNFIHWVDEGAPQLNAPKAEAQTPLFERLEKIYKNERVHALTCDTLVVEVNK